MTGITPPPPASSPAEPAAVPTGEGIDVVARLRAALGDAVDTSDAAREAARADRSGHRAPAAPLAVVRARNTPDVQAVCRAAHETGTPLVTRGAGTGLSGGAVAGAGELVLDLSGMDRILEVSAADRLAVVEPGVLNGALNAHLAGHGLWWAPDPASKDISTVGGNIAMNAGGLLCAKYGVTREAVLSLEVVLADGTVLETGRRTVKGVTGYDLTALMIGSEGTLGVITRATLVLRPLVTGAVHTIGAFFPDVAAGAAASAAITGAGLVPAIMELMDEHTLAAVRAHASAEDAARLPETGAFLLVQADGDGAAAQAERMAELARAAGGDVTVTTDPAESARLVALRRSVFPSLEALGTPLVEDVAVPRSRMTEMFDRIRRIEAETGVRIPTAAHAGDGNLHPVLLFGAPRAVGGGVGEEVLEATIPDEVWETAARVFRAAMELGGTLTGEHGVGLLKRAFLRDELGAEQHALQERIKAVFDPRGILNPGKMFTPAA